MPAEIRAATLADLSPIVELLMQDARNRQTYDPLLWALADDAQQKVEEAVKFALTAQKQPFRQKWLIAEADDRIVGIIHSALLPVPPIYAGEWGEPGLLMPECFVVQDAPPGTIEALVDAAEADLRGAGAELLLASFIHGDDWRSCFEERGYEPLTLYLAKSGLENTPRPVDVRSASVDDIEGIVSRSAENRTILAQLDVFWTPHAEANDRFRNWMKRSLTLEDRDMLVAGSPDALEGYVIAQPASRLHFPPAHDITATGVIDDYFHSEYANPAKMQDGAGSAISLLRAAEAAFAGRGVRTALVVCPAAWPSKISVLQNAGYETAMVWMIKR
ncbi:hypothetical protein ABFT80_21015 [Mesorhizobium sp. SB112]|uniref:hypothetical protein n=1 Tax=Mesorhizobium sp. SB112 TaxID=3151853 RepID=UPI00326799B6